MITEQPSTSGAAAQLASLSIATLAIALVQVGMAISLAALMFSGDLVPALPMAAGSFILGSALTSAFVGWRSSYTGVVSGSQDTTAVIVAAFLAPSTAALVGEARLATALLMVATSSVLVGVAFLVLGRLRLGSLVRFIPQPVVGGFLAGTGWLLLRGGFDVLLNRTVHLSTIPDLLSWDALQYLLPGLALGLFMMFATARDLPPLTISLGVLVSSVLFYAWVFAMSSVAQAESGSWLIGPFDSSARWQPFSVGDIRSADWLTILEQWPSFLTVTLIAVVGLLLNLSALESVTQTDIDIDHELRIAGLSNLVVGFTGGVSAYHLIGDTVLARQLGVRSRIVPIAVGAVGIVVMFAGSGIVGLVPRVIAGGLLAGLGLSLLWGWWVDYVRSASIGDRMVGSLILGLIAFVGALEGVAAGVVVAAALFVVHYGRLEPVRYQLSGGLARSRVDRTPSVLDALAAHQGAIEVVGLEGYLFFGSSTKTAAALLAHSEENRAEPLRFLILDCANVTGMDASAATALSQAIGRLIDEGTQVQCAATSTQVHARLRDCGLPHAVDIVVTVDLALEHAENAVLASLPSHRADDSLKAQLDDALRGNAAVLLGQCHQRSVAAGERIIEEGDDANSVFLIESGSFTSHTRNGGHRLRRVGPGSILGELAFATHTNRTADVTADVASVVYELSRDDFAQLRSDRPDVAADFQGFLVERLASRLASTTAVMNGLLGP